MSNRSHHRNGHFNRLWNGQAGLIAGVAIGVGLMWGYWTVSTMAAQATATVPAARQAEAPAVEPASYDLLGAVAPEDAGYRWAQMARIDRIGQCPDASPVFRNGCARYLGEAARTRVDFVRAAPAPVVDVAPVAVHDDMAGERVEFADDEPVL